MTFDKIKHYLGENLVSFIGSLNVEQLEKMRSELINDMNTVKLDNNTLFIRTVELEYINNLLK